MGHRLTVKHRGRDSYIILKVFIAVSTNSKRTVKKLGGLADVNITKAVRSGRVFGTQIGKTGNDVVRGRVGRGHVSRGVRS